MQKQWMRKPTLLSSLLVGLLIVFVHGLASASQPGDSPLPPPVAPEPYPNSEIYPAEVYLATSDDLQVLYDLNIDFEGLRKADSALNHPPTTFEPSIATVYVNPAQAEALMDEGLSLVPIPNEGYRSYLAYGPGSGAPDAWPTFEQYVERMQDLQAVHPEIVGLVQIGSSVQGRGLWCMEITDNPTADEYEPEFKYTANHHGDETTGIEMTMRLAELLANSYGTDPMITELVDNMEIWLCPIYNPDGYVNGTRFNAHGIDLNRDFPDRFTDPIDDPAGREPETQAFMNFGYSHRFVMGANYHGGAQVLNYPWDAVAGPPYYAPDDQLFYDFGIGYTSRNIDLWTGGWPEGITRGWEWYMIHGGMQDWAYYYHGEHHVTLEISNNKTPPFEQMDTYWDHNRDAMLWWMQRAMTGIRGLVLDARDDTPLDATLTLVGRDVPNTILTDAPVGDYHRVIGDGSYTLEATTDDYQGQSTVITVYSGTVTTQDFYLCPSAPWVVSGTVTDAISGSPLEAQIEFIGSHQMVLSDPDSGEYSINICPATYTMLVQAPWHFPEERLVNIDHDQNQDFAIDPTANLSPSSKLSSAHIAFPEDEVHYQLRLENSGVSTVVLVTDTLPISVTWTGELTATEGIPVFENGQILWQGEVGQVQPITITYGVSLNQCLSSGTSILNVAEIADGINEPIVRNATVMVDNAAPTLPSSPSPFDKAFDIPITATLAWEPSTDLNCDLLTYDLYFGLSAEPDLMKSGLSQPEYDPGPLLPASQYYWYIVAHDSLTEVTGPVWSFTTTTSELRKQYLPLARK